MGREGTLREGSHNSTNIASQRDDHQCEIKDTENQDSCFHPGAMCCPGYNSPASVHGCLVSIKASKGGWYII